MKLLSTTQWVSFLFPVFYPKLKKKTNTNISKGKLSPSLFLSEITKKENATGLTFSGRKETTSVSWFLIRTSLGVAFLHVVGSMSCVVIVTLTLAIFRADVAVHNASSNWGTGLFGHWTTWNNIKPQQISTNTSAFPSVHDTCNEFDSKACLLKL